MSKNLTTEEFIIKAKNIHHNKYDYSLINYVNNKTKIIIKCLKHGIFEQESNSHLHGRGCPICSGKLKSNTNEFIFKAKIKHNNKYDYSQVIYIDSKTKIKIICPTHGIFEQTPSNHLHGYGCIICSGRFKISTNEYIKKANIIHNNKYDYSNVEYVGYFNKIKIKCPIHGVFEQLPILHLKSQGCSKCSGYESNKNIFVEKANIIHNNKYDYSNVEYICNKKSVKIMCLIHGIFIQTPHNHLHGTGCPKCNCSKGEILIENYLINNNINYVNQKKFSDCKGKKQMLLFDFYLSEYNILIEFDGKQHFEPVNFRGCSNNDANKSFLELKQNDKIKDEYCENNKIGLIRIPYFEKNINKFLENKINDLNSNLKK